MSSHIHSMTVILRVDTSELQSDLERIEKGELSLPTVSAIAIENEEIPLFLENVKD